MRHRISDAQDAKADDDHSRKMTHTDQSDLLMDRLEENCVKFASKRAVAWLLPGPSGGTLSSTLTYAELQQSTNELGSRLLASGLQQGDRAVLVYPPSLDFMIAFLACLKIGVAAVPVFPPNPLRRDTLTMFAKIVDGCGAKFALTNTEYSHAKKLSGIRNALTLKSTAGAKAWPDALTWITTDLPNNSSSSSTKSKPSSSASSTTPASYSPRRTDLAFLQYTSGSTSDPKGVQITHGNLAHNLHSITQELDARDQVVVVSWLPQYHDMGLIGSYLGCLYCGGTGYYLSPLSFLQRPMLWMEAVSKYQGTHLQAPNFAFKLTARKFQANEVKLDLSSVQHIINAAEPVDEDSMDSFYKVFAPYGLERVIYPTYGLAEHTVFVCSGGKQILTVDKQALEVDGKVVLLTSSTAGSGVTKLVGCGYPARQNVTVKIVDTDSMQEVAEDVVGEIWIDSPSKAAGYYGMEAETREDFHAKLVNSNADDQQEDEQDYLRSGDLGFLHNSELFICGRLKDLIIIGGRNYYPQDLEATAEASSDILRPGCSAAFSIETTQQGGEEVALVMELKEVKDESVCQPLANSIRAIINQEHSLGIAEILFLQPRTVPKTSSGKIARAWCRKAFLSGSLKVVSRHSYRSVKASFETEIASNAVDQATQPNKSANAAQIREISKAELLSKLTTDLSIMASIPEESIDKTTNLVSMLDSLTISQFKGLLESKYATRISDEYLFRDSTTPVKLVEVVKLGYAPDDGDDDPAAVHANPPAGGLAGALGCPPGVVCVIL
jgi:acyl-CoA synthetase (AMP-forming)/AMP-acid ligase II